jgi:hypothetical protein
VQDRHLSFLPPATFFPDLLTDAEGCDVKAPHRF